MLLKEKIDLEDYFTYKSGYLNINVSSFSKKFNLTGQEYQIYEEGYKACLDVLNKRLNLNGSVSSRID